MPPTHTRVRTRPRYIVSVGLVVSEDGARLLGALYGAGTASTLDQNRIFAAWLQRQVLFAAPLRSGVNRALGSCVSYGFSAIDLLIARS